MLKFFMYGTELQDIEQMMVVHNLFNIKLLELIYGIIFINHV